MHDLRQMIEGDPAPSLPGWRHRALGMTVGEAMRDVPRTVVVEINPPIEEWRLIKAVAAARGTTTAGLVRQLLTQELGRHGITPDQVPWLATEIPLRVRREPRR